MQKKLNKQMEKFVLNQGMPMVTVNTCNILIQTHLKTISQPHIHTYIHTFLRLYQHQARLPAINTDNDNDTNIDR